MQKVVSYIQESVAELTQKVSWPTWTELQNSAIVVMIASLIIAMLIFGMDSLFQAMMNTFYSLFS